MTEDSSMTRLLLENGRLDELVVAALPDLHVLSERERADSLRAALAEKLPGDAWLFAYGSLIWNPLFTFVESRVATIEGWHRAFCLSVAAGRGTVEMPGLVLGLDAGGQCSGVAFRLAEDTLETELAMVWKREMLTGAYVPKWVDVFGLDGVRFGSALTFTIDTAGPNYAGDLAKETVVQRLATASGFLGSSAEYLFQTAEGLRNHGLADQELEELASLVSKLPAAN
jgi:cation transport protein ChaC